MRLTIFSKLFLSLLLICIVVMSGMAWVINSSFRSGFQNYLNQDEIEKSERLAQQVSRYYSETYQWDTLKQRPELWAHLLMQMGEPPRLAEKGQNALQGLEKSQLSPQRQSFFHSVSGSTYSISAAILFWVNRTSSPADRLKRIG